MGGGIHKGLEIEGDLSIDADAVVIGSGAGGSIEFERHDDIVIREEFILVIFRVIDCQPPMAPIFEVKGILANQGYLPRPLSVLQRVH